MWCPASSYVVPIILRSLRHALGRRDFLRLGLGSSLGTAGVTLGLAVMGFTALLVKF